jgi:large subunit ribosomal protein L20
MVRVAKAVASRKRRKRLLKLAKGFVGDRKNHIRLTKDGVIKALAFNYQHRKQRKRQFRQLWTIRINVAARVNGLSYSKFIYGLKKAGCKINRKLLAYLAVKDLKAFGSVADTAKKGLAA